MRRHRHGVGAGTRAAALLGMALLGGSARGAGTVDLLPLEGPPPHEFVVDRTGLIAAESKARMNKLLRAIHQDTDIEVIVVAAASLNDEPIDVFASALFERWQVGRRTKANRGILFVIAPAAEQARLEVSYELQRYFTDAFISSIERGQMAPYFQSAMIGEGIEATVELIARRAFEQILGKVYDPHVAGEATIGGYRSGGAGASAALTTPASGVPSSPRAADASTRSGFGAQPTPEAAWQRFLEISRRRIKDPDLGLYDEASKALLHQRPNTDSGQDHLASLYAGQPYTVRQQGDRAAVVFLQDPNHLLAPWFFHRSADGWQFDGSMYPGVVIYDHLNRWWFKTFDHPYIFAFSDFVFDERRLARYVGSDASQPVETAGRPQAEREDQHRQMTGWLMAGDLDGLETWSAGLASQGGLDAMASRMEEFYEGLASPETALATLNRWVERGAPSAYPLALRGLFLIHHAWAARGGGYSSQVTPDGARLFHERLQQAERDLTQAHALRRQDAAIPAALIYVGTGLGRGREVIEHWFTQAVTADPYHYEAHKNKWWHLQPQWYGSAEEAFAFASEAARRAPRGSPLRLLLARAYFARYPAKQRYQIFSRPELWREIEEAYTDYLTAHPDDMRQHNWYALFAYYANQYGVVRQELAFIEDRVDTEIWGSREIVENVKAKVFGAGRS